MVGYWDSLWLAVLYCLKQYRWISMYSWLLNHQLVEHISTSQFSIIESQFNLNTWTWAKSTTEYFILLYLGPRTRYNPLTKDQPQVHSRMAGKWVLSHNKNVILSWSLEPSIFEGFTSSLVPVHCPFMTAKHVWKWGLSLWRIPCTSWFKLI